MALCQVAVMYDYIIPVTADGVLPFRQEDLAGAILNPRVLPFHLCSLQIFFVFYTTFSQNERVVKALRMFMVPTMIFGAICACFIPTEGVVFKLRTVEYFLFHGALIMYAVMMLLRGVTKMTWRDYGRNFLLMLGLAFFGMWINSFLAAYNTNFLYLVRPPMEGLPLLNLDNGWYVYIVTYLTIVAVVLALAQLPIVLYFNKKRKEIEEI
jgi:uncharacterized membrane protein YwaF